MKTNINKIVSIFLICFFTIAIGNTLFSQDVTTSTTELTAKFDNQNSKFALSANLKFDKDGDMLALPNAMLNFYSANTATDLLIGSVSTDNAGNAILEIKNDINTLKNDTGLILLKVKYEGDTKFDPAEVTFQGMEIIIDIDFQLIDSVKTIIGTANSIGKNGEKTALNGFDILFFTPSLFGPLAIGTGFLEEGICNLKFPKKLPGDSLGNIMVFAKIIDNEIYGNYSVSKVCNWAKKHPGFMREHGKLWTPDPPLWMVITLFILIFGVWSHYVFVFIKMRKMYKAGKQ